MFKNFGGTGTVYWRGPDGNTLAETDLTGIVNEEYIFFAGKRLARVDSPNGASPTMEFYLEDHLGSTSMVLPSTLSGSPLADTDYYPFGGIAGEFGTGDPNHYKFTGKERDSETNNDYFGARYYASTMARWMSPDWSGKPAAVPCAQSGDPQSLNLYGYVRNNPLSKADADGHSDYLWQKTMNLIEGKGWKTDAQVNGLSVAQAAQNHVGSKDWAISANNSSGKDVGHPQDFHSGQDKCNQFVGDTLAEAGKTRPEVPDGNGGMRMPNSHELADPNVHIQGLSDTKPLSDAKPGDVIAQQHGDVEGHSGIIVAPGQTASADATGTHGGEITNSTWGFRDPNAIPNNGERNGSNSPPPVVRTPQ